MRILLAEDNPMNVELFTAALAEEGHDIVVERDGTSAIARASSEPFDLYLLDIGLPGASGYEVCATLRRAGVRKPIVAVTAWAMPAEVERGGAAGFDGYLTKPLSPRALRDAVRAFAVPLGPPA